MHIQDNQLIAILAAILLAKTSDITTDKLLAATNDARRLLEAARRSAQYSAKQPTRGKAG